MRVSVLGAGYVGLVTAACLAEVGHDVTCVDIDAARVSRINAGEAPIFEDGLEELLVRHVGSTLRASTDVERAVAATDLTLIAVGTPNERRDVDLTQVRAAAGQIGAGIANKDGYHVVVVKSTVPPGTTEDVVAPLVEEASGRRRGRGFGLGMNPEFLRQSSAVTDFLQPDRIVIGAIDERSAKAIEDLYRAFERSEILRTTPRTAELIKYASNSLLATLISFSNEIADVAARTPSVDVADVLRGVRLDKRWTPVLEGGERIEPGVLAYLEAGCGFGGACLPKDLEALIAFGARAGADMALLDAVRAVNQTRPGAVVDVLERGIPSLAGASVAVLGLAFKPSTDDVRKSPAIAGEDVEFSSELDRTIEDVDAIIVVTAWNEYRKLPLLLDGRSPQPLVVDGRRMFRPDEFERYAGIGT